MERVVTSEVYEHYVGPPFDGIVVEIPVDTTEMVCKSFAYNLMPPFISTMPKHLNNNYGLDNRCCKSTMFFAILSMLLICLTCKSDIL